MAAKMRVLAVVGPTASGKSALAVALAEALGGEVVGADSVQCYRQAKVGSAQPSAEMQTRVRHHLVGFLEAGKPYSAGQFSRDARAILQQLHQQRKVAILCGGSGLYLAALLEGLSPMPPIPSIIRRQAAEQMAALGTEACYALLQQRDPVTAKKLAPKDRQRIARALEVSLTDGTSLSTYQKRPPQKLPAVVMAFGFSWPRTVLYQRIAQRTQHMLAKGLLEETRAILDSGCSPDAPPLRSVGYRQAVACLKKDLPAEQLADTITRRTCQLAKRQLTWLRHHGFGNPEQPCRCYQSQRTLATCWLSTSESADAITPGIKQALQQAHAFISAR